MKPRYPATAAVVLVVAVAFGGIAAATIAGHNSDESVEPAAIVDNDAEPACGQLAGVCSTTGGPTTPEVIVGEVADTHATDTTRFHGLTSGEAGTLADTEGRPWRIGGQDGESFVLTDDLVPGRVTFEIDEGIVTSASIEQPNVRPPGEGVVEDQDRANLISAAVKRLLTVDNGFGGHDVFDDIRVATLIGTDPSQPLQGLDLELIAETLQELGTVRYIDDADAEIGALFSKSPAGVAVVSVERVLLLDDRAEVELRLWCGSLCGVFLTYEAAPEVGGWNIIGTTGPIAMS